MLAPIGKKVEPVQGSDSPTVICDNPACGRSGLSHNMINFQVQIGSPGHMALNAFMCPGSGQIDGRPEHWACSPECWLLVGRACLEEHMHQILTALHQQVGLIKE